MVRAIWLTLTICGLAAAAAAEERILIRCDPPYAPIIAAIEALGGQVTYRYSNVGGIAAVVPDGSALRLVARPGVLAVERDLEVDEPVALEQVEVSSREAIDAAGLAALGAPFPPGFGLENALVGADLLHAAGHRGDGVVVAVIDTGVFENPALANRVVGGENLVPGATEPPATAQANLDHGTWVATRIAGNAGFVFLDSSFVLPSLAVHSPGSLVPCDGVVCALGSSVVPVIGTAPGAELYAIKVFAAAGGGAPFSRIIAALDRVLTLRRNFDAGLPPVPIAGDGSPLDPFIFDSLPIAVVNMSLSGATGFAAGALQDLLTVELVEAGVVVVDSAGNRGLAAMTGGSPGTGIGTLTVAAANLAPNERVLRDLLLGPGMGVRWRVTDHPQVAEFSARGPSADGRISTDLIASGFASWVMGSNFCCLMVNGTSFSAPVVAGAAALLRGAEPGASAVEIRNALAESGNPGFFGDTSQPIDRGSGLLDLPAALARLRSGDVGMDLPVGPGHRSVALNAWKLGFRSRRLGFGRPHFSQRVEDLGPGEVRHFFFRVGREVSELSVSIGGIEPALPPGEQNPLFGDRVFLEAQNGRTSGGGLVISRVTRVDASFAIRPQSGLFRVAVAGSASNAGRIAARLDLDVTRTTRFRTRAARGRVAQGEIVEVEFDMPPGVERAIFELSWRNDWSHYPTDDLDMVVVDPSGGETSFASLDAPERGAVNDLEPGIWTVRIEGFTVHGLHGRGEARWRFRITDPDGEPIQPPR